MKIYHHTVHLDQIISSYKSEHQSIGFVPTMGALHEGHLSLIQRALNENDVAIVSIFVNPTQFDNTKDLQKYPRTLERDVELLKTLSNEIIVYAPTVQDIYGENITSTHFEFDGLEHEMEGKFRDGHFDGVGTIVKRLFEIVKPNRAYFGKKDFQQLRIIEKLTENYGLSVQIIGCEIYRASSGLAMSSRNERLKPEYLDKAPFIYQTLNKAKHLFERQSAEIVTDWVKKQFDNTESLELEYFIIADAETLKPVRRKSQHKMYRAFIAVYADDIRLIDNIALN